MTPELSPHAGPVMTFAPQTSHATSRLGGGAGICAVTVAVLVAVAVAVLFLVLIGADRSDRLVAPGSDVGHARLANTQGAGFPLSIIGTGGALATSQN